jgi:type II secretory pathway pseudopilin PulG
MTNQVLPRRCRGVCVKRLTNLGGTWHKRRHNAFTLIELVLVVGIITVLTGLVLSTVGYARKKAALARAETEIAAMAAACENYNADNAVYPLTSATNTLDARTMLDPQLTDATAYKTASLVLYRAISGDRDLDRVVSATDGNFDIDGSTLNPPPSQPQPPRSYFAFKPNMLFPGDQTQNVQYLEDPFSNSYGYSTANQHDPITPKGYNPTFDLWSTAGIAPSPTPNPPAVQQDLWIKNW